jgi:hypothetical protein
MALLRRLAEVAREPPGGVEDPGTPVPPREVMMPVDMFTTLIRAHSAMYRELLPSGDRARAVGPVLAKVARVASPPSPVEVGVQAPQRPANTPAMRVPPLPPPPGYTYLTVHVPVSAMYRVLFPGLYTRPWALFIPMLAAGTWVPFWHIQGIWAPVRLESPLLFA